MPRCIHGKIAASGLPFIEQLLQSSLRKHLGKGVVNPRLLYGGRTDRQNETDRMRLNGQTACDGESDPWTQRGPSLHLGWRRIFRARSRYTMLTLPNLTDPVRPVGERLKKKRAVALGEKVDEPMKFLICEIAKEDNRRVMLNENGRLGER